MTMKYEVLGYLVYKQIYGRYLLVSGLKKEIGHDTENFIERNGDDDFLSSNKFYFVDADAETRAKSSKYLSDLFHRLDKRTGKMVDCLTMFYFLQLYRSLWESNRDVVHNHLRLHGWTVQPYNKLQYNIRLIDVEENEIIGDEDISENIGTAADYVEEIADDFESIDFIDQFIK